MKIIRTKQKQASALHQPIHKTQTQDSEDLVKHHNRTRPVLVSAPVTRLRPLSIISLAFSTRLPIHPMLHQLLVLSPHLGCLLLQALHRISAPAQACSVPLAIQRQ